MTARDLNAQVFDAKPCAFCKRDAVACVAMPWGTPTIVCETHRAMHDGRAKLWPAKDAIRAMLRGAS